LSERREDATMKRERRETMKRRKAEIDIKEIKRGIFEMNRIFCKRG
jgi:hypothetical protein